MTMHISDLALARRVVTAAESAFVHTRGMSIAVTVSALVFTGAALLYASMAYAALAVGCGIVTLYTFRLQHAAQSAVPDALIPSVNALMVLKKVAGYAQLGLLAYVFAGFGLAMTLWVALWAGHGWLTLPLLWMMYHGLAVRACALKITDGYQQATTYEALVQIPPRYS
jgi:hypothetical protein